MKKSSHKTDKKKAPDSRMSLKTLATNLKMEFNTFSLMDLMGTGLQSQLQRLLIPVATLSSLTK